MKDSEFYFRGKYIIKTDLKCLTGLSIGGITEGLEIGGIDNPVIKDQISGLPYIPGSSLKGRLRSLSEWIVEYNGKTRVQCMLAEEKGKWQAKPCNCGKCDVCIVFGSSAEVASGGPTRLTVRDAFPSKETIEEWERALGEGLSTEFKTENVIDRITSKATPRTMERVPRGSIFEVEMIYDIYREDDKEKLKILFQAMHLLENSSLGGSGNRGYGSVMFDNIVIIKRSRKYYTGEEKEEIIKKAQKSERSEFQGGINYPAKSLSDNFDSIIW